MKKQLKKLYCFHIYRIKREDLLQIIGVFISIEEKHRIFTYSYSQKYVDSVEILCLNGLRLFGIIFFL